MIYSSGIVRSALRPLVCVLAIGMADANMTGALASDQAAAALLPADRMWLDRIQTYLNGIVTLKAQFQQLAPNGKRETGTVWLNRPGRLRFAYNKPSALLLVANHGQLVFNDSQLGQTTTLPLDHTPLGLLLRPVLKLSGDVTVTNFVHSNGQVIITLVRTASPGDGSLTLMFRDDPLSLQSWIVIDSQGQETRVDLFNAKWGNEPLPDALFNTDIGDQ